MNKLITIFLLIISTKTFAQRSDCYLPSGDKCPKEKNIGKNMLDLNKKFEQKSRTYFLFPAGTSAFVVFKSFSKEPLYILTNKKTHSSKEEIKEMIENVDYQYYFGDYNSGLKMDLKKFIQNKSLTDLFILDTMGSPNESKETFRDGKSLRYMEFNKFGIRIYFSNSIAIAYDEI